MHVIRMIKSVNKDGIVNIQIPKTLGEKVEIIIFPATTNQIEAETTEYFECIAEDGTEYRTTDWTDEDFNRLSKTNAFKDDDTVVEDVFNV